MTPDYHKYFNADGTPREGHSAITESQLYPMIFYRSWHEPRYDGLLRLYRVPGNEDGCGCPCEVTLDDVREGDTLVAMAMDDKRLFVLQFWHIVRIEDNDSFFVLVDNWVGMGSYGETLHDKFAGALGLIPTE